VSRRKIPDQVVRIAILFMLAVAALLYAQQRFTPPSFGRLGHYRADGQGVLIWQDNTRVPRTWEVKGIDQVCVKLPWESPCDGPPRLTAARSTRWRLRSARFRPDARS